MKQRILAGILAVIAAGAAQATLYQYSYTSGFSSGGVIADGNVAGWSDTRTISGISDAIADVNVRLEISGGYNGDLYGYLVHSSGFAVLLNRSGRTGSDAFGYGDAGFNITLGADGGSDIHSYGGNGGLQLTTGSWLEDGRNVNPATVLGTAGERTGSPALLSSFNTLSANGDWTLFLADMASGDTSTLVSWGLDIEAVPEPITWALALFGGVLGAVKLGNHWRRRKGA